MNYLDAIYVVDEINNENNSSITEGAKKQIVVNAYERNPKAKRKCIDYYKQKNYGKLKYEIFGFDFSKKYGKQFENQIHIHHIIEIEISSIGHDYVIDAEKDLLPVCPNCHLIIHSKKPAYKPEELKNLIEESCDE